MSLRISLLAVLLAACDSQVDSDHQGDVLAKIGGSVRNTRSLPIAEGSEVVVVWHNTSGTPDLTGTDSVEVEGSFPAQFTLSIYEPPAANLLNDFNGVKVGVAYIIAGTLGADFSTQDGFEAGLLGMEENHLLVYVPDGVPADSDVAFMLRGGLTPGFHLFGVHKLTDEESEARQACIEQLADPTIESVYTECGGEASFDDFVPLETDLATPLDIELIDDPSTVDGPNWT